MKGCKLFRWQQEKEWSHSRWKRSRQISGSKSHCYRQIRGKLGGLFLFLCYPPLKSASEGARNYSLGKARAKCGPLTAAFANFVLHNSLFCIAPSFLFRVLRAENAKNKFNRVKILLFESCCFGAAAEGKQFCSPLGEKWVAAKHCFSHKSEWKMPLSSPFTQVNNEKDCKCFCFFCLKRTKQMCVQIFSLFWAEPQCQERVKHPIIQFS